MVARRLYQTAAEQIAALIDRGEFAPGTRLPGERELSQRLGVSRVTVREAEIALQATGRLQIRNGAGVYVSERAGDPLRPDRLEVLEARLVVESEAASLAAHRIVQGELAATEDLLCELFAGSDDQRYATAQRFHLAIASLARNIALADAVNGLWLQQGMSGDLTWFADIWARDEQAGHGYRAIVEALRAGDPTAARRAMRECIDRQIGALIAWDERKSLEAIQDRIEATRRRFGSRPIPVS